MDHEVTLFASGELRHSRQAGGGVATCVAVRAFTIRDTVAPHMVMIERVARRADEFDVVFTVNSVPLVSISDAQRRPLAQVDFVKTIHHGIPEDLLTPQPVKQEYAAFLGRVSPEKGVDKAIRIAGKAGARVEDRRKGG